MKNSDRNPQKDDEHGVPGSLDPAQFMRNRRPELYSDSELVVQPQLTPELLEYHLETLTNRSQETEFEYFCRRLAEKEICPNLRPQTGPTGGGDSKADSETIPISPAISRLWIGVNQEAGQERWAFAFSAKKKWTTKVRSDVDGVAGTKRDYKRIYFITNQFARSQTRARIEDELAKKYGVPVYILDRAWILKCVFENDHIELAVETLGLTGLASQSSKRVGPRDLERSQELEELEAEINDPERYVGAQYQLAEDCLRAALLARGLQKPRTAIEGYFARAERIAEDVQHPQQLLRITYERAWTAFWWYNDFAELNRLYATVEELAAGSQQADDLELVFNLWQVLSASVRQGKLGLEASQYAGRTDRLKAELERLAGDAARPNNALQARTNRLLISLNEAMESDDLQAQEQVWADLSEVVKEAKQLGDYPFEKLAKLVNELGAFIADSEPFDQLFEAVANLIETRRGEGEGGKILLERGYQKLKNDKPYEAIRLFGRAQERLIKREYREELVIALMGCSIAYRHAGLLWAARNCALAALERSLAYFVQDGFIIRPVLPCLQKLIWSELELGRVPQALDAYRLSLAITPQLKLPADREKKLQEDRSVQDAIIGMLLLRASLEQLGELRTLPNVLEEIGLYASKLGLLYALGCVEELRDEEFVPADQTQQDIDELMRQWAKQPAAEQVPQQPNLLTGAEIELRSNVLGCELHVTVANNNESIFLAEALLGGIEAFLATSLEARIAPFRQGAKVLIKPSADLTVVLETSVKEVNGEQVVEIVHSPSQPVQPATARTAYRDSLQSAIVTIMCHIAVIQDVEEYLNQIAGEERAFGRALNFAEVGILVGNVFGSSPKLRLTDWTAGRNLVEYPLRRSEVWNSSDTPIAPQSPKSTKPRPGSGEMPEELRQSLDTLPHQKRRVMSLIDIPLWDKAQWCATVYMQDPSKDPPLLLGIGFRNPEAARAIFKDWHKRFGIKDLNEELRVSILTGVNKSNPYAYNVVIGTNIPKDSDDKFFLSVSRINQMTPQNSVNLNRFTDSFKKEGRYVIAPVQIDENDRPVGFVGDVFIEKTELNLRPAWEVGENDIDAPGIVRDDDPIIPPDVKDAPVNALLRRRQANSKKQEE